jgi:hypothetical protein
MNEIQLIISPEGLAQDILPGVEAGLYPVGNTTSGKSPAQRSAGAHVAMAVNLGQAVSPEQLQAAGMSAEDISELTNQLTQIRVSLADRLKSLFHEGEARVEELAKELAKIIPERAEKYGISTARYLEKLQKGVLQYVISTYLLDPISVHDSTGPATLGATSVTLNATVTLNPTVSAGPDVVQAFLVSLFNMSLEVSVGYGSASS